MSNLRRTLVLLFTLFPISVFAADGGDSLPGFFWRLLVFATFIFLLYKLAFRLVNNMLDSSVENVKKHISDVEQANKNSKDELNKYARKLAELNQELKEMEVAAKTAAEHESDIIISNAEDSIERMDEKCDLSINAEIQKAKNKLRKEVSILAIEKAEKQLIESVDDAANDKYINDSLSEIGV